ncbi:MAG: Asp-tRNA(Asn)/Glu-tRNA(Gln) amidotransferase subunit GatC [Actinomycetota bacterium]|nr:Asp-tRNA(Asn)/Glu-tRNA(Gln) amidotransferase GatCAB subunit C [Acidimicrobiaceae bacterium]MEC7917057.1 Asp-tRNA(Asn)/Glu-tRNA(Gln) amidotransferase subunit GatC [Actinomycetota bacterium]MEE3256109.1 Asp-tRNA(Asn)/Glu-tRNA(Gln) amidotransferase subunit GatC [Actinomycetota bacterium]|tara:strand:+ start:464 stop:766 length:303 start_codon:yes stop_codon:yes gene_type:complete
MKDSLSQDLVAHIASLARIDLNDGELLHFTEHLEKILDHAGQLETLDLDSVEPMSHPYPLTNVLRDDVTGPTIEPHDVMNQAPDASDNQFRVPPILGESS